MKLKKQPTRTRRDNAAYQALYHEALRGGIPKASARGLISSIDNLAAQICAMPHHTQVGVKIHAMEALKSISRLRVKLAAKTIF